MADSQIVIDVAKAMFKEVHGYHPDLNWDNAFDTHRELYLKYARIADGIYRTELLEPCEHYVLDHYIPGNEFSVELED